MAGQWHRGAQEPLPTKEANDVSLLTRRRGATSRLDYCSVPCLALLLPGPARCDSAVVFCLATPTHAGVIGLTLCAYCVE